MVLGTSAIRKRLEMPTVPGVFRSWLVLVVGIFSRTFLCADGRPDSSGRVGPDGGPPCERCFPGTEGISAHLRGILHDPTFPVGGDGECLRSVLLEWRFDLAHALLDYYRLAYIGDFYRLSLFRCSLEAICRDTRRETLYRFPKLPLPQDFRPTMCAVVDPGTRSRAAAVKGEVLGDESTSGTAGGAVWGAFIEARAEVVGDTEGVAPEVDGTKDRNSAVQSYAAARKLALADVTEALAEAAQRRLRDSDEKKVNILRLPSAGGVTETCRQHVAELCGMLVAEFSMLSCIMQSRVESQAVLQPNHHMPQLAASIFGGDSTASRWYDSRGLSPPGGARGGDSPLLSYQRQRILRLWDLFRTGTGALYFYDVGGFARMLEGTPEEIGRSYDSRYTYNATFVYRGSRDSLVLRTALLEERTTENDCAALCSWDARCLFFSHDEGRRNCEVAVWLSVNHPSVRRQPGMRVLSYQKDVLDQRSRVDMKIPPVTLPPPFPTAEFVNRNPERFRALALQLRPAKGHTSWTRAVRHAWDSVFESYIQMGLPNQCGLRRDVFLAKEAFEALSLDQERSSQERGSDVPASLLYTTLDRDPSVEAISTDSSLRFQEPNMVAAAVRLIQCVFDRVLSKNSWLIDSGTLTGLMRYGSLEGWLSEGKTDMVDMDIDIRTMHWSAGEFFDRLMEIVAAFEEQNYFLLGEEAGAEASSGGARESDLLCRRKEDILGRRSSSDGGGKVSQKDFNQQVLTRVRDEIVGRVHDDVEGGRAQQTTDREDKVVEDTSTAPSLVFVGCAILNGVNPPTKFGQFSVRCTWLNGALTSSVTLDLGGMLLVDAEEQPVVVESVVSRARVMPYFSSDFSSEAGGGISGDPVVISPKDLEQHADGDARRLLPSFFRTMTEKLARTQTDPEALKLARAEFSAWSHDDQKGSHWVQGLSCAVKGRGPPRRLDADEAAFFGDEVVPPPLDTPPAGQLQSDGEEDLPLFHNCSVHLRDVWTDYKKHVWPLYGTTFFTKGQNYDGKLPHPRHTMLGQLFSTYTHPLYLPAPANSAQWLTDYYAMIGYDTRLSCSGIPDIAGVMSRRVRTYVSAKGNEKVFAQRARNAHSRHLKKSKCLMEDGLHVRDRAVLLGYRDALIQKRSQVHDFGMCDWGNYFLRDWAVRCRNGTLILWAEDAEEVGVFEVETRAERSC